MDVYIYVWIYVCIFHHISGTPGKILTKLSTRMSYYLKKLLWGSKTNLNSIFKGERDKWVSIFIVICF